jgi:hypothetical protein
MKTKRKSAKIARQCNLLELSDTLGQLSNDLHLAVHGDPESRLNFWRRDIARQCSDTGRELDRLHEVIRRSMEDGLRLPRAGIALPMVKRFDDLFLEGE